MTALPIHKEIPKRIFDTLEDIRVEYELSEREMVGQASLHLNSGALTEYRQLLKERGEEDELREQIDRLRESSE